MVKLNNNRIHHNNTRRQGKRDRQGQREIRQDKRTESQERREERREKQETREEKRMKGKMERRNEMKEKMFFECMFENPQTRQMNQLQMFRKIPFGRSILRFFCENSESDRFFNC